MIDTQETRNEQALELCLHILHSLRLHIIIAGVVYGRRAPGPDYLRDSIRELAPYRGALQRFSSAEIETAWQQTPQLYQQRFPKAHEILVKVTKPQNEFWLSRAVFDFWFTLSWFMGGNPTLFLTRQQIAALAFCNVVEQPIENVRLPWAVFYIPVPTGLLLVGDSYVWEIEVHALRPNAIGINWEMLTKTKTGLNTAPGRILYGAGCTTKTPIEFRREPEPVEKWRVERSRLDEFISRIVFNAIYAINEGHKIEKTSTGKMRDYSDQKYITGHKLNLPIKIDNVKYLQMGVGSESGRQYTARWMVRGHWREQACGKDRKDHRRIFIEPHWKGPEAGTILQRNYKVTDEAVGVD